MATFVLVHGAFQGGWVWRPVASLLEKKNHQVYTPTLTGAGERVHLLDRDIDLNTYIHDVTNVIYFESLSDVILVGHSYAGMIITAVADKLKSKISRLIYLDAVVPEAGKSFLELTDFKFKLLLEQHVTGWQVRPWPLQVFGIRCEEDKRWFSSKLVQFPFKAFDSMFVQNEENVSVLKTYIHCTEHENAFIKRIAAQCKHDGWDYYEMQTGHSPMVTMPAGLADMLTQIALSGKNAGKKTKQIED